MDFLDPRRKKAHKRRLIFGYALMSILIAIGSITLLYLAYGYDVNRKTGELIQNGIVYLDSRPTGASVYFNNLVQPEQTNTRLDVPSGKYNIKLQRENYRDWTRTINLDGGEIERLVYPLLIPNVLQTSDTQTYNSMPQVTTQSPDRRWLLIQRPGTVYQFDMFDLNQSDPQAELIQVPVALLTEPSAESTIEITEWSTNNRHVLLERKYANKSEYIIFDRENPDESVNLNTALGINPKIASLKNKRHDQIYFMDSQPGVLRLANVKDKNISAPLIEDVIDYSTYGDDLILFVTRKDVTKGKAEFKIKHDNNFYTLKQVTASDNYVLDISRYDNEWYYVAGSSKDNVTFVYTDPIASLRNNSDKPLEVKAVIRLDNPRFVRFSANTQFILVQSGNKIVTVDLEDDEHYFTELKQSIPLSQELKWMDGHRLLYVVNNQSYMIDFDGSNENTLVTSMGEIPYFDRDYDNVYTLEGSKSDAEKQALTVTVINLEQ